jgi:TonB-dependent receptor
MVFRVPSTESPVIPISAEPARISPAQRFAAWLIIVALAMPPGVLLAEPVPLEYFAANTTSGQESPAGQSPETDAAEPQPAEAPADAPAEAPAEAPAGDLAPPDGVPVQAPFPADGSQAESGIPLPPGNCVVTGEVSDATSLNPIAGAFVDVIGTGRTAQTDASGKFRIDGLPPGTYTLEATKLGYFTETSVVTAIEAQPSEARFGLRIKPTDDSAEVYTLEEETVVGEYTGDSPGDLFSELEITSSVTSAISKEEFSTSGISDAADAVSKISGANIVGGKYAVVRGMADRYSNTLVNNGVISSADPSKKAVQLDLFPSDLLESLSIRKTFTPDLPADFAGGTVLIETLRIPDERIIDFSIGAKYEDTLDGDFYVIPGQRLSFWGDGSPGVPKGVGQRGGSLANNPNRFAPGVNTAAGPTQTPSALQLEALEEWRLLQSTGPFIAEKGSPQEQYDFSATYADFHQFGNEAKLGWVFALTREQGAAAERDVEVQRLAALAGPLDVYRRQTENRYKESVDWGFLGSVSFELADDHSINYTYFNNRSAENEVNQIRFIQNRQGDGQNIFDSSKFRVNYNGASGIAYRATDVVSYLDRQLEINQLNGSHAIRDDRERERFRVSWLASDSTAEELRPDDRNLRFTTIDYTDPRIPDIIASTPPSTFPPAPYRPELGIVETLANSIGGNPPSPYRQALSTIDEGENQRIDLDIPIYFDDSEVSRRKLIFKLGVNRSTREREQRGDRYVSTTGFNRTPASVNIDQLLIDLYQQFDDPRWIIGANRPASGQPPYIALGAQDISAAGTLILNADTGIDVDAKYLMASFDWDAWNLYGGARIEKSTRSYSAEIENEFGIPLNNATQAGVIGTEEIEDEQLYPSFGVSRAFGPNEDILALFAWSRTVARPTFLEFAPIITEDQSTGEEIRGNPLLEDSEIDNFDLSLSWQVTDQSFLQFSLFHKTLTNPITKVLGQRASDGFFISYANAESGTVQGLEFDVDHRFNENWNVGGNLAYITSQLVPGISSIPAPIFAETFEGQPNWILNLNLGYTLPDYGVTANLVYNYTGEYLAAVSGTSAVPSVVRDASNTLDFILRKSFESSWGDGTVTFKISNLLNDPTSFSYENGDVYSKFEPGREYSLSLSFGF